MREMKMTPEQLKEAKEKWDNQWPYDLRDRLANLIDLHLIKGMKDGHIAVSFIVHDRHVQIAAFTFEITSEVGKLALFQATNYIKTSMDEAGINYSIMWTAEYKD